MERKGRSEAVMLQMPSKIATRVDILSYVELLMVLLALPSREDLAGQGLGKEKFLHLHFVCRLGNPCG